MGCSSSKPTDAVLTQSANGGGTATNGISKASTKLSPATDLTTATSTGSNGSMGNKSEKHSVPTANESNPPPNVVASEQTDATGSETADNGMGAAEQVQYRSDHSRNGGENGSGSAYQSDGNRSTGDLSAASNGTGRSGGGRSSLRHSTSKIFVELDDRLAEGDLKQKVVHIEVPFGKPIEEVYGGVHTGPVLGSGISGLVRLVTHKATGVKYAVKCLDLGLIETEEGLQQLREEIFIMCQLDHPNIVRLEEVYESHTEIYLVQELCLGGELFDRLDEQPDYHYTEQQCARLVKQMLCAVRYIHSKGIVHRDLKLENFLFSTTSPDSELKMIDFGLSKHFTHGEVQHEAVGTPYTVAPEVIRGGYNEKCDVWAIGVITFLLLSGDPPFGGCGGPEPLSAVRSNILRGSFKFEPEDIWCNVSQQARDFISSLLIIDPALRPNASQAQKNAWLREWAHSEKKTQKGAGQLSPNVVKALVNFKEYSDMRKLLCEVLSFTLLPEQIQDLRAEFEKMDTDGSGEITLSALKTVLMQNAGAGSLGALTEEEVEDIFNAMRVRKSEPTIQWHEFIAAGLSQCQVDDRNLRLAFDRLDGDHKGYISFDDVLDLVGNSATEETLRVMFQDSLHTCASQHARITYEDFLLLMKGQTRDGPVSGRRVQHSPIVSTRRPWRERLQQVEEEGFSAGESKSAFNSIPLMPSLSEGGPEPPLPGDGAGAMGASGLNAVVEVSSSGGESEDREQKTQNGGDLIAGLQPTSPPMSPNRNAPSFANDRCLSPMIVPGHGGIFVSKPGSSQGVHKSSSSYSLASYERNLEIDNGPLTFDEDDGDDEIIGLSGNMVQNASGVIAGKEQEGQIPQRVTANIGLAIKRLSSSPSGALDAAAKAKASFKSLEPKTPPRHVVKFDVNATSSLPFATPTRMSPINRNFRRRSKSVDEQDSHSSSPSPYSPGNEDDVSKTRVCVTLPEHDENDDIVEGLIRDETKTPLVVNRELYRAHRRMRLAVLEASKRFEEKQVMRQMNILDQNQATPDANMGVPAGLVMRHGQKRQMSSESVRHLLHQNQKETQAQLEKVVRKSGRGRRSRKKTVSDMTGMMLGSPLQD